MSDRIRHRSSRRRVQLPSSPGRNTKHEPARRQSWAGLSTQEILARYKPGTAPPLKVLDVLIDLFNTLHTSLEKTVSHKTRQERAQFLRRFFRDLSLKAGFKMAPDPRNLGQKHIPHPGIVSFFELDSTADGQPYLAMELVEGAPIDRHCDERQLTITQRLELFDQLCGAVFYLHRQGIVHRDLKPSNVLVARDGRVKLLDFGIAKALDSGTFHTRLDPTESKIHLITPGYCSPEQVRVKRVTPASDVYSLAVLLFELLVGAAPYRFESSSPQLLDILQAVYQRPPCSLGEILELAAGSRRRELELCRQRGVGSLAELRRQLPPALEAALAVAFAQDPAARPPHAGALAKLIRQALDSSLGARLRRLGRRMLPAAAPRRPKKT